VTFLLSIIPGRGAVGEGRTSPGEERDLCGQSSDQKRDLLTLRVLDQRVQKGELSERERQLLWQAYLARVSSSIPSLEESEGKKHEYDVRCGLGFVGPAF
jgi:hypothetical protein